MVIILIPNGGRRAVLVPTSPGAPPHQRRPEHGQDGEEQAGLAGGHGWAGARRCSADLSLGRGRSRYSAAMRRRSGSSRNHPMPTLHIRQSRPRTHLPQLRLPGQQAWSWSTTRSSSPPHISHSCASESTCTPCLLVEDHLLFAARAVSLLCCSLRFVMHSGLRLDEALLTRTSTGPQIEQIPRFASVSTSDMRCCFDLSSRGSSPRR